MLVLENTKPKRVFHYFEEIAKIPHASYNTKGIVDYLEGFAKEHSLSYNRDKHDNIIIYKEASAGYEDCETVIIQGHSDMVAEKTLESTHDFATQGLNLVVEGDYLSAKDTTLGADDGIAVAMALAILEDDTLLHPAIEVLITSNEEVGLLGAMQVDASALKGTRLINLDSEGEGILLAGCAGGVTINSLIPVKFGKDENTSFEIAIGGLKGGHSGAEIDKNRANANALMGRVLRTIDEQVKYTVAEFEGGDKGNVITPSSRACIMAKKEEGAKLEQIIALLESNLRNEYANSDDGITITISKLGAMQTEVLDHKSKEKLIFLLTYIPFGVHKMSGVVPGLVETSSNIGLAKLTTKGIEIHCSIRSMIGSAKDALANQVKLLTEFWGGEYSTNGDYPAWEFKKVSPLRDVITQIYQDMFKQTMKVEAIHAGLECGILHDKMPYLDCVALGPNIDDIHSPDERISILSTERTWELLLEILKELK